MFKIIEIGIIAFAASFAALLPVQADRLKDLTSIAGVRPNQLVG